MRAELLTLLALGCSTTQTFQRPLGAEQLETVNRRVQAREIRIDLAIQPLPFPGDPAGQPPARSTVEARELRLEAAQATWTDGASGKKRSVPIEAVEALSWPSDSPRLRGALDGAGIGVLTGIGLGAVIGLASGDDRCDPNQWCIRLSAGAKAAVFGVLLGGLGLISGAIAGALIGHHDELEFTAPR